MREAAHTPTRSSFPMIVAILGAFLIFYVIINLSYESPDTSVLAEPGIERPLLAEHEAIQSDKLTGYSVIDAASGKVRLSIDRAKSLVVSENAD